ncbi:hypothetical protein SETIT_6G190500v2 [Setaria italica]|uniref:Uncharacterized protein n=1 Tax=Setaria italica TaxID=4555 RepID=A0A368RNB4_SETIT|nr:hypothetical protein SETIT_6G190500v2 [Setaria italica]
MFWNIFSLLLYEQFDLPSFFKYFKLFLKKIQTIIAVGSKMKYPDRIDATNFQHFFVTRPRPLSSVIGQHHHSLFPMPSSPWPPTAGAPPPGAAEDTTSTAELERRPVEGSRSPPAQKEGSVAAAAASAQESMARLPSEDYFSEVKTQEHGEKINKYQGMLAARLKAKYFSMEKGDMFEEIVIQSETIRLSRWPFTRLFADPAKFCREKSYTEKEISPSLAGTAMSNN